MQIPPGAACTKHLPPCMLLRVELRIGETSMAQNLNYPGFIYFEGRACFSFGAIVEICPFNVGTHSQTPNQNIKTEISKFNSKSEFGFLVKRSGTNIEGARSNNHRQNQYKTQNNLIRAWPLFFWLAGLCATWERKRNEETLTISNLHPPRSTS